MTDNYLRMLIEMAQDWTDPVVVKDAPERVPHVIEQLILALKATERERDLARLERDTMRVEALAFVEQLESHYDFQCEGGPLKNCVEWQLLASLLTRPPKE